jgi:hypothetical protein
MNTPQSNKSTSSQDKISISNFDFSETPLLKDFFTSRTKRSGNQDWHELCMQLIQFAGHSEILNSKQSLRNQQLQQDNQQLQQDYQKIQNDIQQRINTLDDVRQE